MSHSAAVIAGVSWFARIVESYRYTHGGGPTVPDPRTGHVYYLREHQFVAYITQFQFIELQVLALVAGIMFVIAFVAAERWWRS